MERRVHVFSPDQRNDWGFGTYVGETTLRAEAMLGFIEEPLEEFLALFSDTVTTKIKLDSGEDVYGLMCWWADVLPAQN